MDFNSPIGGRYVRIVAIIALLLGLNDASRLLGVSTGAQSPIEILGGTGFVYLSIFAMARLFAAVGLWIRASWGAVLLVALNVVGLNAWAWKERAALETKREAIRQTLTRTFPNVRAVVDAPVQMEREVAALRQQTGVPSARDLDALLVALASALPPGRTPGALEYGGGELRARGLGLSPEEARTVASQLRPLGYIATATGDVLAVVAEDAR